MRFRGLAIACIVLLALGGLLYWSGHHKTKPASAASAVPAILKIDPSSVQTLTIKARDAAPVVLARQPDGDWRITGPKQYAADQDTVTTMLSDLSPLDAERVIESGTSDLKAYGLDAPAVEIDISAKGHAEQRLLFGDNTPTGYSAYAMVAGNPRIFTVGQFNKTGLDKSLNDLRDKRLITMDSEKMSRIDLIRGGQDIQFARNADGWQILKPAPYRADTYAVDGLADSLAGARMNLDNSANADAGTAFARGTPVATAKVTGSAGMQTIELRKDKEQYYAKSSIVDGAYAVDSSLADAMNKKLDDFRNKQLFDFSYNTPNKIDLVITNSNAPNGGTKSWQLVRAGDDWWWNGKKMKPDSVDSLVESLRDLTATSFAASGFTTPLINAAVTSNDGKRVEKVLIAKSGSSYLAKRDGEPALYALDASTVEAIQSAADNLQPALSGK